MKQVTSMPNMTQDSLTCLSGGQILTFDKQNKTFNQGELWLTGKEILTVCEVGGFMPPPNHEVKRIDTTGKIIVPGFVNSHTHSYSAILKGTVEKNPLDIYMLAVIAAGSSMTPRETYVSAQLDALSMLKTGITSLIDHYSERPALTAAGLDAVCGAFKEIGVRATVATMFADKPYIETVPIDQSTLPSTILEQYAYQKRPDANKYFDVMETAIKKYGNEHDRIQAILGVDGPQRCSDTLIEMTGDFQKRNNIGLHTHMLETKTQAVMRNPNKESFVSRMLNLGILNERSSLVHFIWAQDDDIAAAKEAGVTIVHCPQSNTMLGAGICPVLQLRNKGIPVAYGTDGSNCGPASYLETLRLAAHLMRLTENDFEKWPNSQQILKEAYQNGARALGWEGRLGALEPGMCADFVVLQPVKHWHQPMGDPFRHLFYYENGQSTESVWVDGEQVVKDGFVTTINEQDLLAEAAEIVTRRKEKMPNDIAERVASQYPVFKDMIIKTLTADEPNIKRRFDLQ